MKELASWHEEQRSAHLYRLLAELEAGAPRARLFSELAREAESFVRAAMQPPSARRPAPVAIPHWLRA